MRSLCFALLAFLSTGPAIAAGEQDLEEMVRRLARIGFAGSPSFSPDGRTLAFVSDMSGTPQVWTVPAAGGWPTQLTALDDTVGGVSWSPAGDWLAVSAAPGGGMNQQLYLVNGAGTDVRRLTRGGSETNWIGPWSDDGTSLALSSNLRTPAAMDAYVYQLETGEMRLVAENPGIGRIVDLGKDGSRALLNRVAGRGSNDLYLLDTESGDEIHLTAHQGPGSFSGALGPEDTTVYIASNLERDLMALGRLEIEGRTPSSFELLAERQDAELESFEVDPLGRTIALIWNVAGKSELEMLDLETGNRRPIVLSVDLIGSLTFNRRSDRLALVGRGARAPSDLYVLNLSTGTGRQVTHSPHPGVSLETLIGPELVRFPSHDGLELSGWLYRPPGTAERPVPYVLSFHGGPEGQERPSLRSVYQALIAGGIGVFAPNIRGSSGFGKRFVNLDNRELRFDANRDIAAGAEYLVAAGVADGDRLGIMGGSYGGYAVMVGVTEFPDLFAAGVNLFGMVNFETFFEHTEPWMAAISGTEYGDPVTQRKLLRRLSPLHKLDRVKTPLLVQHGANDTNVPVVEAEQVVENLRRRGVPVEYILFPDEGHGFRKTANRITSTVATVEWFVKYLAEP